VRVLVGGRGGSVLIAPVAALRGKRTGGSHGFLQLA
jgi:hypothetical protein